VKQISDFWSSYSETDFRFLEQLILKLQFSGISDLIDC
jgi:hypothetical protein